MEESIKKSRQMLTSIMNIGAIFGGSLIIIDLIFYYTGLEFTMYNYITRPITLLAGIILGTKHIRDKYYTLEINYGKVFWLSFRIVFFMAILFAFYKYLLCRFIDPDYILNYFSVSAQMIEESGMSEEFTNSMMDQFAQAQENATPFSMAQSDFINKVLWGAFISLITSIGLRKKSDNPFSSAMSDISDNKGDLPQN